MKSRILIAITYCLFGMTLPLHAQSATWIASATGLATTAAYTMSVEAGSLRSLRIAKICVGTSNATVAAAVNVVIQRRTTASSGGTVANNESTTTPAVSVLEQADGPYPGVVRVTATLGTAGAILDQWSFSVGELGAGAADPTSQPVFCNTYGDNGDKRLTIPQGTGNGISISVDASGAGGLASGSISAVLLGQGQ